MPPPLTTVFAEAALSRPFPRRLMLHVIPSSDSRRR